MTKKECLQEAKVCQDVAAALLPAVRRAHSAASKETEKNRQQFDKLVEKYGTLEDAEEAFAYGEITRSEYDKIRDRFEGIEQKSDTSHKQAVYSALFNMYNKAVRDAEYWKQEAEKEATR